MRQSEIIKVVAENAGIKETDVDTVLRELHQVIADCLKNGEEVKFHGFGKFSSRNYGERKCYNPQTKKLITLNPSVQPSFVAGPKLRNYLNN